MRMPHPRIDEYSHLNANDKGHYHAYIARATHIQPTQMQEIIDKEANRDKRMEAGQSKRIWEELYKVLDASDVILQVLDARDPNGTRSYHIEEHLKKNCPQKHLVQILNKCDLVPTWVTVINQFHFRFTTVLASGPGP